MKTLSSIGLTLIFSFLFVSCVKKVNSEGTVYYKNGEPVVNVTVTLLVYTTGSDVALKNPYHVSTDQNGHFMFHEMVAKNRYFGLDCESNGQWFHSRDPLSREQLKHYDIHLK